MPPNARTILSVTLAAVLVTTVLAIGPYPDIKIPETDPCAGGACGEPLFLTPLIKAGAITKAQQAAEVHLAEYSHPSYSGYLTTDPSTDSNLFFWYFEPQNADPEAPLVMWLQGGPGATSLFGLFGENGPISVAVNGTVFDKPYTWNSKYAMVFFDQPAGTGYSFTNSSAGLATTETEVADSLYLALTQFFTLFPSAAKRDFYVAGESYGGKYVPAISYKIHQMNAELAAGSTAGMTMNLKGLAVGDGWCDPASQVPQYPAFMYNLGLVDSAQRAIVQQHMDDTMSLIGQGKYVEAYYAWDAVWGDYPLGYPSLFTNFTGSTDTTNFMRDHVPPAYVSWGNYATSPSTRKALHVGGTPFGKDGGLVYRTLMSDFMHSISPRMPALLDNYKVLIYNGQVDSLLGSVMGEAFMDSLEWTGSPQWGAAKKTVWRITPSDPEVAGFVKCVDRVFMAVVRGAGHFVPADQPARAFNMIDRFITEDYSGFCDAAAK